MLFTLIDSELFQQVSQCNDYSGTVPQINNFLDRKDERLQTTYEIQVGYFHTYQYITTWNYFALKF